MKFKLNHLAHLAKWLAKLAHRLQFSIKCGEGKGKLHPKMDYVEFWLLKIIDDNREPSTVDVLTGSCHCSCGSFRSTPLVP